MPYFEQWERETLNQFAREATRKLLGQEIERTMNAAPQSLINSDCDLVDKMLKRAEIRRQISTRKSVQEGKPDRIADLLEEAAAEIERLKMRVEKLRGALKTASGWCFEMTTDDSIEYDWLKRADDLLDWCGDMERLKSDPGSPRP